MKLKNAKRHDSGRDRTGSQQRTAVSSCGTRIPRGLTLVEVMVTMVIFVILAGFAIMAVKEVVTGWQLGERRRVVYEKGAGVLDRISSDIRLTLTQEPVGVTEQKARFISNLDPATGQQRLMFVRSFEAGPERAITFNAGDGIPNDLMFKAGEASKADKEAVGKPNADSDNYTGMKVGDFKALGGMAMVGYFTSNRSLYRAIHAPVPQQLSPLLNPAGSQLVATDVLFLSFEYWGQDTMTWDEQPPKSKTPGPERIWDSTRSIPVKPLSDFRYARGQDSAMDFEDDIFPEKVRVTVVVDSPMPRCVYTKLTEDLGDNVTGFVEADSTRGFADGGDENSYMLIGNEWIRYKNKKGEGFYIDKRGERGTKRSAHAAGAIVRQGRIFRRVVFVPNWREDLTSEEEFRIRKEAESIKPRKPLR